MSEHAPHPERLIRREERRADDGRLLTYYTFEPVADAAGASAEPAIEP